MELIFFEDARILDLLILSSVLSSWRSWEILTTSSTPRQLNTQQLIIIIETDKEDMNNGAVASLSFCWEKKGGGKTNERYI